MDYGSKTEREKTSLYNLEPQFCGLSRLAHLARLQVHGVAPRKKKWNRRVFTRFSDLVVPREEKDERKWVFLLSWYNYGGQGR